MKNLKANKTSLIRWKIYIDRAKMYVGYIQFFMIGFVFLKQFEETKVGQVIFNNLWTSIPTLFILFLLVSLFLGRLDTMLGLREEELRNSSSSNPVIRDIRGNLEKIKLELEKLI